MKKFTRMMAALLLLTMALTLCACDNDTPTTNGAPEATTTAPVPTTTQPVPTTTVDDGLDEYTVTVLYPDGSPAVGVKVAVCDAGGNCSIPRKTGEDGVVVISTVTGDSMGAKVIGTVEGYEEMHDYVYFEGDSKEVTITLVAIAAE